MTRILLKILNGAFIGIAIGYINALVFSVLFQAKYLFPSAPLFVSQFKTTLNATVFSTILWALIGCLFTVTSFIFQIERWSITRQTVAHFVITFVGFTPLALLSGWFPISGFWLFFYVIVFILIYFSIWSLEMLEAKRVVAQINDLLNM